MTTPDTESEMPEVDERPNRRREWSGGLRSVLLPLAIVGAIVFALWYLERGPGGGDGDDSDDFGVLALDASLNPTGRAAAAEVGRAAPDFRLSRLSGGDLRLSDLRGQVVILNFWATWCAPCREEMPEFVRQYAALRDRGLEIVAVDLQEAEGPVQAFVNEFGIDFPVLFDRSGEVARTYRVKNQIPGTMIIDRNGVIRAVRSGPVTPEFLQTELEKVL